MLRNLTTAFICLLSINSWAQQSTVVEGDIKNTIDKHSALTIYKYINITESTELSQDLNHGYFKFSFGLKDLGYINFSSNNIDLQFILVEPGDSIHISLDAKNPGKAVFTGKGSEKITYQYLANKKFKDWFKPSPQLTTTVNNLYFNYLDSCRNTQIGFLDSFKISLTPTAYKILKADIVYDVEGHKTRYFLNKIFGSKKVDVSGQYFNWLSERKKFILSDTLAFSRNLIDYLRQLIELDYNRLYNISGGHFNFESKYSLEKSLTYGKIQERVLAAMLLLQMQVGIDAAMLSETDYLNSNYNPEFKQLIHDKYEFQKKFGPGKQAVNFTLPDLQGKKVSLDDFKGKLVLVDFYYNGCVGCAALFKAMPYVKEHFKNNKNVVFINVSVDNSAERWLSGIKLYNIADEINLYTEGLAENHPVIRSYGLNGYPSQFLISRDGKYITSTPPRADLDNGKELIKLIEHSLGDK